MGERVSLGEGQGKERGRWMVSIGGERCKAVKCRVREGE